MADWKTQINYNYNPSYHAYAYGLMYQPGHEQNHGNLTGWGDNEVMDLSNYDAGVTQAYYAADPTRTQDGSPSDSPEEDASGLDFQGSGVVYLGDTQAGRLLLAGPRESEVRRTGSDSTSDSEAHISPNSWSSGSSREGSLPQADPVTWIEKELEEEVSGRSPDAGEDVSSPLMQPQGFAAAGNENTDGTISQQVPITAPKKPGARAANTPKGKVRAAFSESQMNTLVQRFSVQRYLTPAEMKNLAEMTGMTYKQVKTWFQNRRMKLRRHQKDTTWVSERFNINKDRSVHGAWNMQSHIPPYQGEARPQHREHYNQHMMEVAFKKNAPQNLAFYLAAMGGAAGSGGYPSWSSNTPQNGVPNGVGGWPVPPGGSHYQYNPNAFNSAGGVAANNIGHNANFEGRDGEPMNTQGSLTAAMVHNVSQ